YNIAIGDFFAFFAAVECVLAIDRQTEIANRAALGCVTHLRIAREISEEDDFVKAGHALVIANLFVSRQLFPRKLSGLFFLGLGAQSLVMLAIDFGIELKFRAQFRD